MSAVLKVDPIAIATQSGFVPGVHHDLDETVYRKVEAISYSGAKKLLRSGKHYLHQRTHPSAPTSSMSLGTAVGYGVLQPHLWDSEVVKSQKFDRRTKEGKAGAEAFERECAGKLILDPDEYDAALQMIESVRSHPGASALLSGGRAEVSMMWVDAKYGVPCKGRVDYMREGFVDLKTTKDASPKEFARQASGLMYHVQAAAYYSGALHTMDRHPEFWAWICVENEAPFATACYIAEPNAILAGDRLWDQALVSYKRGIETGVWSGYPDTIEPLKFPKYALTFQG